MHKTGSTAIQSFLHSNYDKLLKKDILYPKSCRPEFAIHGQHIVPWLFTSDENYIPTVKGKKYTTIDDRNPLITALIKEIEFSGCSKIVLSSEEFDILTDNELEFLFSYFSEYEVVPITFIRNTIDFLQSSYQTSVTYSGYSKSFEEFCENQRSRIDISDFLKKLDSLSNGRSIIVNYDDINVKSDVVKTFLSLLHVDIDVDIPKEKSNISLPLETIEVLRFFNSKSVPFDVTAQLIDNLQGMKVNKNVVIFSRSNFDKYKSYYYSEIEKLNDSICKDNKIHFKYNDNELEFMNNNLVNSILKIVSKK